MPFWAIYHANYLVVGKGMVDRIKIKKKARGKKGLKNFIKNGKKNALKSHLFCVEDLFFGFLLEMTKVSRQTL